MQELAELHPQADLPEVDVADTVPVQTTAEILAKALQRLQRGSSGRPLGWAYEHIKAACGGCAGVFNATMEFMSHVVSGNLPDTPD